MPVFDELLLVRPICLLFLISKGGQLGRQDIPRTEKTPPEVKILQYKVSEALGIGNNLEV